ncbi:hypothetical protein CI105_02845 [Candidatus Izimaplasma bacterium ZiA1]|uniref:DUF1700 domain-containing protein n=1 Tax=Candidatus Izimoplasma sp. ZiA1 TaxID=2024899 RepID=UPI000BAA72CD|nr:hypothetical protein CI105_02845 [Candidatus Izimaplasma bacterium ZiA1]
MSKLEFINELKNGLGKLSKVDKDSLIKEYEEYFEIKASEGLSEEEILADLEDPKDIIKYATEELIEFADKTKKKKGLMDFFIDMLVNTAIEKTGIKFEEKENNIKVMTLNLKGIEDANIFIDTRNVNLDVKYHELNNIIVEFDNNSWVNVSKDSSNKEINIKLRNKGLIIDSNVTIYMKNGKNYELS